MSASLYTSAVGSMSRTDATSRLLSKVFKWMFVGLGFTGLVSYGLSASGLIAPLLRSPILLFGLCITEFVMVFVLASRIDRMSAATSGLLFFVYAGLNGVTLSPILIHYAKTDITSALFITAGMFGAMAVFGMTTKRDLTGLGSFLIMGVVGLLIASVVNIFLHSSMLHWIISCVGVLCFTGLTAYDVQKISSLGSYVSNDAEMSRCAISGALALYLDFINLFLMVLRFFDSED